MAVATFLAATSGYRWYLKTAREDMPLGAASGLDAVELLPLPESPFSEDSVEFEAHTHRVRG
jgi:hypothetical protein